jgi:hypothetical protein
MNTCNVCGAPLILNVNWLESYKRNRSKECTTCKREKAKGFSKAYRDKHKNDQEFIAKARKQNLENYQRHKEARQAYGRKWSRNYIQKLKLTVLSHYSDGNPKCECCNEKAIEFLSIDHINGGGTKHRKVVGSSTSLYRWLIKNNYPKEFRTLCMNCNFALGKFGYCPHKSL